MRRSEGLAEQSKQPVCFVNALYKHSSSLRIEYSINGTLRSTSQRVAYSVDGSMPSSNKRIVYSTDGGITPRARVGDSRFANVVRSEEDVQITTVDHSMGVVSSNNQLSVTFELLCGFVPARSAPPTLSAQLKASWQNLMGQRDATAVPKKQVLFNVTGEARPGEILALMGPSGSGKTTLLSTLAGRAPRSMKLKGSILYNGKPLTKAIKRRTGYVLQDDLLYESLTVTETLTFAALLRLPQETSHADKLQRVESVMSDLGIVKCRNTIIGGGLRRGVSGGERKRVSVGHELLTDPAMILLDEPTSGLDSTTAQSLLALLSDLAVTHQRTIVTTIHQPSSRMYDMIDKLLLLSDGHILYSGAASQVIPYFAQLGLLLPYSMNVAEFFLDLATGQILVEDVRHTGDFGKDEVRLTGPESIVALYLSYEHYARNHLKGSLAGIPLDADLKDLKLASLDDRSLMTEQAGKGVPELSGHIEEDEEEQMSPVSSVRPSTLSPVNSCQSHAVQMDIEVGDPGESTSDHGGCCSWLVGQPRVGASYMQQLKVLLIRSSKVKRFEAFAFQKVFQFVAVAIISGLFWWQIGQNITLDTANDVTGLLFFMLIFPATNGMLTALYTFPTDYRMLLKERASGMYRVSAFYFARTLSDLPVDAMLPTVFITIAYYMGGLRFSGAFFIPTLLSVHLMSLVCISLGLMLGAIFMNPRIAQAMAATLLIFSQLVGGFFVRTVPGWISWLKYLSYIYWSYNLLLKIQLGGVTILDCSGTECTPVTDVQAALNLMVNPNDSVWPEVIVLFGLLVFLRCVIYVILRHKTVQKT